MKVLLTGAFGNIGSSTLKALLEQGNEVRCFDLKMPENEKVANKFKKKAEIIWGNLTKPQDLQKAVDGVEAVIHMGYIIPPISEEKPEFSEQINVGGTQNLLRSIKGMKNPAKLLFISSISIFGPTQKKKPPRRADEPLNPSDHYSTHKARCEKMIKDSGLKWAIIRYPAVPPIKAGGMDPMMFSIPLETRMEFLHTLDAGLAAANVLKAPEAWGKVLLIGGGPTFQVTYGDYLKKMLETMGLEMLPKEAFDGKEYYTDWVDSTESQRILQYQKHDLNDLINDLARAVGWKKYLTMLMKPLVRKQMLKLSPYYKQK